MRTILVIIGGAMLGYAVSAYRIERVAEVHIQQNIQQIEATR